MARRNKNGVVLLASVHSFAEQATAETPDTFNDAGTTGFHSGSAS